MPYRRRKLYGLRKATIAEQLAKRARDIARREARNAARAEARRRAAQLTTDRLAQLAASEAAGFAFDVGVAEFQHRLTRQHPVVGLTNFKNEVIKSKNKILPPSTMAGYTRQKVRGAGKYRPYGRGVNPTLPPKQQATNRKNVKNVPKPKSQTVQAQIKRLAKKVNIDLSKHTHRYAQASTITALDAECDHEEVQPITPTLLETFTNSLRFYDSTGNALDTADPTSNTFSHDVHFKNVHSKLTVRNNYHVPCRVKVYLCKAKSDTTQGVVSTYTAGLVDQCVTAGADTESPLMYPTDIEMVKEQWDIDCVIDKYMLSGDQYEASHSTGQFSYDPSHADTETATFQKQWKSFLWLIRLEGVLGHDTAVAFQVGRVEAKIDYEMVVKAEIEYNSGGVQLNDFSFTDNRDQTYTNNGVAGVRTIPNNETTSVA